MTCHADYFWIWLLQLHTLPKTLTNAKKEYSQAALQCICRQKLQESHHLKDLGQILQELFQEFGRTDGPLQHILQLHPREAEAGPCVAPSGLDSAIMLDLPESSNPTDIRNWWPQWLAAAQHINKTTTQQHRLDFAKPLIDLATSILPSLAQAFQCSAAHCSTLSHHASGTGRSQTSYLFLRSPGLLFTFELCARHWEPGHVDNT